MSALRDAALGYAARGIPVLPLHHPVTRPRAVTATADGGLGRPQLEVSCSCRDRSCGPVGKHPIGQLVPGGLSEATNRARILAWWARQPQANIGPACGHRFDVLDLDGPAAVAALQHFTREHGIALPTGGPVVRTGRVEQGWHYYLAPSGLGRRRGLLEQVEYQALGGYVVAPPSRHPTGHRYRWARDLEHPLPEVPGPLRELVERQRAVRPAGPAVPVLVPDGPGHPYARAALAHELARVAAARQPGRNNQLWESGRNLYNLVAAGALDEHEVHQRLLAAAQRNGLLADEPRQTRRTLASARQVGLAHPRRLPERAAPEPTTQHAPPTPAAREAGERTREGR
jgi:hypothetical protein